MHPRTFVITLFLLGWQGSAFAGTLFRTNFETADWPARTVATSSASVTASAAYGGPRHD